MRLVRGMAVAAMVTILAAGCGSESKKDTAGDNKSTGSPTAAAGSTPSAGASAGAGKGTSTPGTGGGGGADVAANTKETCAKLKTTEEKFRKVAGDMAKELITVATTGDESAIKGLMQKYGKSYAEIATSTQELSKTVADPALKKAVTDFAGGLKAQADAMAKATDPDQLPNDPNMDPVVAQIDKTCGTTFAGAS